jgi:TolA-binding protein
MGKKRVQTIHRCIKISPVCGQWAIVLSLALALLTASPLLSSCSVNSAQSHFILAEKLWSDGQYEAAVREFEKVTLKDPSGKLGKTALLRAASTQSVYLAQYDEAIRKFRTFVQAEGNTDEAWKARTEIGEMLYNRLQNYGQAEHHYLEMLQVRPKTPLAAELAFRVAKSQFFQRKFDNAIGSFQALIETYPNTPQSERAAYEIGVTYFTRGEQNPDSSVLGVETYKKAIASYEQFLKLYPNSHLVPMARFGIASCLEEMDQLDDAYARYLELQDSFPSPNVIQIKLIRIKERQAQRSR